MLTADLFIKSSLAPLIFPTRRPYPRCPKFQPPRDRRTFNLRRNPRFQVFAEYGVGVSADDSSKMGEECSLVEISATRTLPAAVTYMEGVRRLRAAVEEVKANPPGFSSGVLRFQVAVPPSSKALNWLCCQHGSLVTLPQFCLLRNELHELPQNLDGMLGVSGIGSTIYFHGSLSTFKQYNTISRYLSIDSPLIRAYGFLGIHYNKETCLLEDKPGSFYFFIPQIELNEFETYSLLASTLVWDDTLCHTFDQAIHLLEHYLHQVIHNGPPTLRNQDCVMSSIGRKPFFIESKDLKMINLSADVLLEMDARCLEQEEQLGFYQSYYRHSTSICFGTNKFFGPHKARCSIKECANINVLWSSLIIEECVRLGLTYFCIAPGSRSSPLAVSACSHSLTTCISCYDERSLAYHAVGYGRGSNKPAVVITSSGTAVSNLLPAVVEASHDFVPVLLLTADRPPELQDAGANQAIDQVNHFGNFVRFFFSLPTPTDQIPARMVLTTIDSAVYSATQAPCGPVHINCPFREPLENFPRKWSLNCLRGIDFWISESDPFTKYIKMEQCLLCDDYHGQISEVLEIMQSANRGLLLIGAIHTEDEMWAALLLVKHLSWPVVSDVLSGLRLRKVFTTRAEVEGHFMFIDHMDHALLSDSVKMWAQPDVVVQIGSKITSKRLGQFLESSSQCSYILVDKHPRRYDPYHIITHRVQSSITQFSEVLLTTCFPRMSGHWGSSLKALNEMASYITTSAFDFAIYHYIYKEFHLLII